MGDGKSRSLTRAEFVAVMKRASELAVSDPYDGSGSLDEAEVLRIATEVGLRDKHVHGAMAEVRSNEHPNGIFDGWFGATQVRGSRVVAGSKEDLQNKLDHFLVAGNLLEAIRQRAGSAAVSSRRGLDRELRLSRGVDVPARPLGGGEGDRNSLGRDRFNFHTDRDPGGSGHSGVL